MSLPPRFPLNRGGQKDYSSQRGRSRQVKNLFLKKAGDFSVFDYNTRPMPKITFLGAAGTVTGSKYLVEAGGRKLLVDCGLFEGAKDLKQRNWEKPPVDPATIDWVLLTHAHI